MEDKLCNNNARDSQDWLRVRVVDANQKQKDVSSFVDIYNTKRWEIESPGNQTTDSRPARDEDISQADIKSDGRLMQRKNCAILVSAAKEIRLVVIYMLNKKLIQEQHFLYIYARDILAQRRFWWTLKEDT